jgi:hypothetical protein
MKWKAEKQAKPQRKPISRADLEQEITEFVRASDPDCREFAGVILEAIAPASSGDTNWAVKGVRYGKADRKLCDVALSGCVAGKQLEFELSDPMPSRV